MHKLLTKKINGLYSARDNVIGQKWDGLILHIIVPNRKVTIQLIEALKDYSDTNVSFIITIANYPILYFEKPSHINYIKQHGIENISTIKCLMPKQYCY